MEDNFSIIRFSLFTKSYAGFRIATFIKNSQKKKVLIKNLSHALLLEERQLKCFILHKTCVKRFNKIRVLDPEIAKKIAVYTQIEKELITLSQEKSNKSDFAEEYEYGEGLLSPAIEHVAGDSLGSIKSDHKFEERIPYQINKYRNWYYDIAYKYGLPTLRIAPFILREIISNN
jgi:hypothetical protein